MGRLSFISSLVASLSWPVVVIAAMVLFRHALSQLISRIRSYKGMGQELEFGERLASAEESADLAVKNKSKDVEGTLNKAIRETEIEPRELIREAENNPSYVVIRAWEDFVSVFGDLAGVVFPGRAVRGIPARLLTDLQSKKLGLNREYYNAIRQLRDLRNEVAHGQAKPTPGEAVAYVRSTDQLIEATGFGIQFYLSHEGQKATLP